MRSLNFVRWDAVFVRGRHLHEGYLGIFRTYLRQDHGWLFLIELSSLLDELLADSSPADLWWVLLCLALNNGNLSRLHISLILRWRLAYLSETSADARLHHALCRCCHHQVLTHDRGVLLLEKFTLSLMCSVDTLVANVASLTLLIFWLDRRRPSCYSFRRPILDVLE